MSKPNKRRVRLSEFRAQLAEAVLPADGMVTVELDDEGENTISFQVPLNLDAEDEYAAAIQASDGPDDLMRVVLGDEQGAAWLAAGGTSTDFAVLFGEESQSAAERMRDFRYRPSTK